VNPPNFFSELKRRNVYKVAIAYAVLAWLLMQVASQIFPFFDIPNWAVRLVVLLLVIGFPIALILAWAFELTLEGIKRTGELNLDRAVPLLQHALAAPAHTSLTPAFLRLDPFWDPVRNDPRFDKLANPRP
jgi:hypothetical protein